MEAPAWQCGAVCGPQTQPQRARSRLIELRPLSCLRRSKCGPAEYTGIATIRELILTGSPVQEVRKTAGSGFEPSSRRQIKPFMKNARAHQKHQRLLIGNACAPSSMVCKLSRRPSIFLCSKYGIEERTGPRGRCLARTEGIRSGGRWKGDG